MFLPMILTPLCFSASLRLQSYGQILCDITHSRVPAVPFLFINDCHVSGVHLDLKNSSMSTLTSRPLGFLDFSAELQSKVYEHYFANTHAVVESSDTIFTNTAITFTEDRYAEKDRREVRTKWNIVHTCRSCYQEARDVLYGCVTLYVPSDTVSKVLSSQAMSVRQAAMSLRTLVLDAALRSDQPWAPLESLFPQLQKVTVDTSQDFLHRFHSFWAVEDSTFRLSNGDDMSLWRWVHPMFSTNAEHAKLTSTNVTCNLLRTLLDEQRSSVLKQLLPARANKATRLKYNLCVHARDAKYMLGEGQNFVINVVVSAHIYFEGRN